MSLIDNLRPTPDGRLCHNEDQHGKLGGRSCERVLREVCQPQLLWRPNSNGERDCCLEKPLRERETPCEVSEAAGCEAIPAAG
jgi:hypothetical protein